MFNDLNFLNGSHKKVSNYPWNLVWWVFWQNWNSVQMWHMILEHKPQYYIDVFLFCWHFYSPFTGFPKHVPVSTGTKLDHMQENSRSLTQHNQADRQTDSQLTVTSKSIFQLTFFTPAAAFSISLQVTDPFSYWCITAFMTEYSDCNMWSWHRCQSRYKIPDIGRCVFLFLRRF